MLEVVVAVAEYYQLTVEELKGKSRKGDLPEARKMACYLLRNTAGKRYIAAYLRLPREYVYQSIKDISFYINTYSKFKQRAMEIEQKSLIKKREELESFLKNNYNADKGIIHEKQRELKQINNQINN